MHKELKIQKEEALYWLFWNFPFIWLSLHFSHSLNLPLYLYLSLSLSHPLSFYLTIPIYLILSYYHSVSPPNSHSHMLSYPTWAMLSNCLATIKGASWFKSTSSYKESGKIVRQGKTNQERQAKTREGKTG